MAPVKIVVKPVFLPAKSNPDTAQFVFAYTITIENLTQQPLTLRSRYWRITDANDAVQEVRGEGVVGQTPCIVPGGSFTYSSGAVIATTTGLMEGAFYFEDESGATLEVAIPTFALVPPGALH